MNKIYLCYNIISKDGEFLNRVINNISGTKDAGYLPGLNIPEDKVAYVDKVFKLSNDAFSIIYYYYDYDDIDIDSKLSTNREKIVEKMRFDLIISKYTCAKKYQDLKRLIYILRYNRVYKKIIKAELKCDYLLTSSGNTNIRVRINNKIKETRENERKFRTKD